MNRINSLAVIIIFGAITNLPAQSILEDYFKGNKDSLVAEATKLISMPEPTFKPYRPTQNDLENGFESGSEKHYSAENHFFTTRDNKSYRLIKKWFRAL